MTDSTECDELAYLRKEVKRLRETLNELTPHIDIILRRRGFQIYRKKPAEDLLLPREELIEDYYRMLHKYSFRLFLRDVIQHQDFFMPEAVTRYSTATVTEEYIAYLFRAGLVGTKDRGFSLLHKPVKSFGETLEWYVSEILRREFGFDTLWGVKFKRPAVGGDYDVLAKYNGSILYMEVKSSPPKQVYDREITAFFQRVTDLSPDLAIFFMDTELRMKDKIVPMFDQELKNRFSEPPDIVRMEKELFQMQDRIFIINAKGGIIGNIQKVLQWHFRR